MALNKTIIRNTLAFILIAEMLSFLAFYWPQAGVVFFVLAVIIAIIATAKKLEYGVLLLLAELIIGSKGYIFALSSNGVSISIRIVLWLIVVSFWLATVIKTRKIKFWRSQFLNNYIFLAMIFVWAIAWGLIRNYNFGTIFFDVNNYLYFILIFPIYEIFSNNQSRDKILSVGASAIAWLTLKTIILFYIFSHAFPYFRLALYSWSRQTLLAEVTSAGAAAPARVFMQSQIFILLAFFVALGALLYYFRHKIKPPHLTVLSFILLTSALVASFSRSFWVAAIATVLVLFIYLLTIIGLTRLDAVRGKSEERNKPYCNHTAMSTAAFDEVMRQTRKSFIKNKETVTNRLSAQFVILALLINGVALVAGVSYFPFPSAKTGAMDALAERGASFKDEPAVNTRFAILAPLMKAIIKHPVIGAGFGSEVTYKSQDPRVLSTHVGGWYTTTAFEWGYLDMWLKIGLFGLIIYLWLIYRILRALWRKLKTYPIDSLARFLTLGAIFGFVALLLTNGVSPYLNHPLGIGLVILATCFADSD